MENLISWEDLVKILDYCPDTGVFTWKINKGIYKPGDTAGGIPKPSGYLYIGVNGIRYLAHRLAWFYCFKEWPELDIDHINRIRNDNRLDNLREVSRSVNLRNSASRSTSGFKNVYKNGAKYWARVWVNYEPKYLGTYDTAEQANQAVISFNLENNLL